MDEEKREVLDRLGEEGLERLRDGDPTVKKDYVPPDEILRRVHNDGAEPWHQMLVTSTFSYFSSLADSSMRQRLRWLPIALGLLTEAPSVTISASEDAAGGAAGRALRSGDYVSGPVTFKFALSGKSTDFSFDDITHNCEGARFLGMKTTYYLQCASVQKRAVSLSVAVKASTFKITGQPGYNTASETFHLTMAPET